MVKSSEIQYKLVENSNKYFSIIVFLQPVPKGRPRFGKTWTGNPTAYTPIKTRTFESSLKKIFKACKPELDITATEAIELRVHFRYGTKTKKKFDTFKTTRPDLDNLMKAIKDAMDGVVFPDDSLVAQMFGMKSYSKNGSSIEITAIVKDHFKIWT